MNPYLAHMSDRELLEQIYILLLQVNLRVSEIDNDSKQFGMNLVANLLSNMMDDMSNNNRKQQTQ